MIELRAVFPQEMSNYLCTVMDPLKPKLSDTRNTEDVFDKLG